MSALASLAEQRLSLVRTHLNVATGYDRIEILLGQVNQTRIRTEPSGFRACMPRFLACQVQTPSQCETDESQVSNAQATLTRSNEAAKAAKRDYQAAVDLRGNVQNELIMLLQVG